MSERFMSERFYIHYADDTNRQLVDTESDFNIHIEEIYSEEELIQLCNLLNELNDENIILKSELSFSQNQNRELRKVLEDNRSMAEVVERNKELEKENEKLQRRLSLYEMNEDEVDKYLRTHPMPTITNERTIIPLGIRHRCD